MEQQDISLSYGIHRSPSIGNEGELSECVNQKDDNGNMVKMGFADKVLHKAAEQNNSEVMGSYVLLACYCMHDLVSAIKSLNPFEDNVEALTSVRNDSVRFLSMSFSNMDVVKKYMSS